MQKNQGMPVRTDTPIAENEKSTTNSHITAMDVFTHYMIQVLSYCFIDSTLEAESQRLEAEEKARKLGEILKSLGVDPENLTK